MSRNSIVQKFILLSVCMQSYAVVINSLCMYVCQSVCHTLICVKRAKDIARIFYCLMAQSFWAQYLAVGNTAAPCGNWYISKLINNNNNWHIKMKL